MIISETDTRIMLLRNGDNGWLRIVSVRMNKDAETRVTEIGLSPDDQAKLVEVLVDRARTGSK